MFYLFKIHGYIKANITEQLKEECMYHMQLVERLKKVPDYQQLTTSKLIQILHQSGELSTKYII